MAAIFQEIPENMSRQGELGLVSQMKQEKVDHFRATNLYLDLLGTGGAGLVSNIWRRGGPETLSRVAVLKGLAQDVRAMPRESIDPGITRGIYKSLHKVPEEILTQPDQLAMRTHLPGRVRQTGLSAEDDAFTYGLQQYYSSHPKTGTPASTISFKISDPLKEVAKSPTNIFRKVNMMRAQAGPHEVAHTIQMNPVVQERLGLSSELKTKLEDLRKINNTKHYNYQPLENISRGMENFAESSDKMTKKKFMDQFEKLVKFEHRSHFPQGERWWQQIEFVK